MRPDFANDSAGWSADVLVVDDDADARWAVCEVLRSSGLSVDEAPDGEAAASMLESNTYGAVLLDIRMPKRDGVALVEGCDEIPPVVIQSAFSVDNDMRARLGSKVVGYLQKPVRPQKLLRAVDHALAGRQGS